ncbi:MAG: glycosyl hydrolase family 8 [Anaerolineales bacterium]
MMKLTLCLTIMVVCGSTLITSCSARPEAGPAATATAPAASPPSAPTPAGAFSSGAYRNLFAEYLGKSEVEIQAKLEAAWEQFFYGDDSFERLYYPVGEDMAYIEDIGNGDVRSEGLSYGMMIAVQLDRQEEFNRLWKWAKTYMVQSDGPYRGYFAWHCSTDGEKLDANPASDGEEWFVTDLFFAFSDPSYHLPAYYELWARWAQADNKFWAQAAQASRAYFKLAANPTTGLMPDYANFDGTPYGSGDHQDFRFDAWRTLSNVAVDYAWFAADPWQVEQSNRVLDFLTSQGDRYPNQYTLEGTPLSNDHSTGLAAMAAVAALAAEPEKGTPFVQALWEAQIPSGKWRYYDGLLYLMGLLHASGHFKIYTFH